LHGGGIPHPSRPAPPVRSEDKQSWLAVPASCPSQFPANSQGKDSHRDAGEGSQAATQKLPTVYLSSSSWLHDDSTETGTITSGSLLAGSAAGGSASSFATWPRSRAKRSNGPG